VQPSSTGARVRFDQGDRTAAGRKKPQAGRLRTTHRNHLVDMSTRRQIVRSTRKNSLLDPPGDWRT
jgi:hypothetical protein